MITTTPNRKLFDKAKGKSLVVLGLMVLIGISISIIGFLLNTEPGRILPFFLIAFGGGLLATGLGQSITVIYEALFGNIILDTLSTLASTKLLSDATEVHLLRKKFYYYYKSKHDGKYFWRCILLDFSQCTASNYISTHETIKHPVKNHTLTYHYEAAVRGSSLILLYTKSGEEPAKVIFPTFNKHHDDSFECGILFHQNWDDENTISPAVILTEKKYETDIDGIVKDYSIIEKLWYQDFFQKCAGGIPLKA